VWVEREHDQEEFSNPLLERTPERERERERERGECEKGLNQGVADFTVWFVATCLDSCI
jgi:hypothetical protein